MIWVYCVVRSPYGMAGMIRQVQNSGRVQHYLSVGVLAPSADPAAEAPAADAAEAPVDAGQ